MRYTINLATRTYLDHRLINRIAVCVIILLFVVAGWYVSQVASNAGELSRLNSELTAIQSRLASKPSGISEADFNSQKTRIRYYNEIIERKSTNWLNILEQFENVTPEGISLSSLSPGKDNGAWTLSGNAKSFKAVQMYLEKIEGSKSFTDVMLLSHHTVTTGVANSGVQFTMSCKVVN
jgi:type IV pilus assembly protein PilN